MIQEKFYINDMYKDVNGVLPCNPDEDKTVYQLYALHSIMTDKADEKRGIIGTPDWISKLCLGPFSMA